jgi:hypothetical protein
MKRIHDNEISRTESAPVYPVSLLVVAQGKPVLCSIIDRSSSNHHTNGDTAISLVKTILRGYNWNTHHMQLVCDEQGNNNSSGSGSNNSSSSVYTGDRRRQRRSKSQGDIWLAPDELYSNKIDITDSDVPKVFPLIGIHYQTLNQNQAMPQAEIQRGKNILYIDIYER